MSTAPASASSPSSLRKNVLQGWKLLLARLAGRLIRSWVATLRITTDEHSQAVLGIIDRPTLFALWHNRLFVAGHMALHFRGGRPLHALISTSKDGAWLTAFFQTMGLSAVRGSSSKGGREAVGELIQVLAQGGDAGITPDGPRGPLYVAKPGALIVARRANARVVLLGMEYQSAWRLRSWDRFLLPRPFSRVHLTAREFPLSATPDDSELQRFESALRALNPRD